MKPTSSSLLQMLSLLLVIQILSCLPNSSTALLAGNLRSHKFSPSTNMRTRRNNPVYANYFMPLQNLFEIQRSKISCCKNHCTLLNKQHEIIFICNPLSSHLIVNPLPPEHFILHFQFVNDFLLTGNFH